MTAVQSTGTLGSWELRAPTPWEFFGFDGSTNKQNLDIARRKLLSRRGSLGWSKQAYFDHVEMQYRLALGQLAHG